MPELRPADAAEHLPPLSTADSPLTEIVRCLVGRTVEEVERELILCSLSHYHGNRTHAAKVLGISVRTMRNKIGEYATHGVAVPSPGQKPEHEPCSSTRAAIAAAALSGLPFLR
jgi:two-component system response regulator FlrC